MLRDPGAAELVEEAVAAGADVVGGIPWIEATTADQEAHVERACALAARLGRRVAMLTDEAPRTRRLDTTRMLAEAMRRHGLEGRGAACHARAVGHYEEARRDGAAGTRPGRRARPGQRSAHRVGGGCPVEQAGSRWAWRSRSGQDDVEDAYYPFGRHNLLEVAFLAAHLLDMRAAPQLETLVDLVTTSAARVLGVGDYGLRVGGPADLLVHGGDPDRRPARAARPAARGRPRRPGPPLTAPSGGSPRACER